ncbi:P-loop containing nucleoside triphosphate hydrolase protein [Thamnocephalis sphaerospora]|uniref:DNA helicase n=1 Tax=Thamnocephalis sphaerospora TaxID=78915 RepID=A0A4P9XPL2_9FUNG|nr:P-loop containing nucleoside triphosphate hydrolase protein [Thamnocephalis sphaerospora]|eukprot:RKP07200.1 P-loop containing nucleoside triphosphate hydrolase protein [Thamnocephalis sphaerospora]
MVCTPELFVERQLELIEIERKEEVERTALLRAQCSPQQLQQHCHALLALQVTGSRTGLGGKCMLELSPATGKSAFPPHLMRPGDVVSVERGDSKVMAQAPASSADRPIGVVWRVSDTRLVVALPEELPGDWGNRCRVVQMANDVTYDRLCWAMRRLRERLEANDPASVLDVLLRGREPRYDHRAVVDRYLDPTLDDSQRAAVQFALSADELALVHGPPGTGKTYTLTEIIRQLVARGKRVLVCGPSNVSVDNLVERLAPHKVPMLRLGHPARTLPSVVAYTLDARVRHSNQGAVLQDVRQDMDTALARLSRCKQQRERRTIYGELRQLRKEYRQREAKVTAELIGNARVVLCTLSGADTRKMRGEMFDVAIIDEAAQALEAECWIAIHKARCVILAGDHCQLPPTVLSVKAASGARPAATIVGDAPAAYTLDYTLFDRMLAQHGDTVKRMLLTQYRMHRDIMAFPSGHFYDAKLQAHASVAERLLTDKIGVAATEDTEVPVVWIDTADCGWLERVEEDTRGRPGDSRYNEGEVAMVKHHVARLVQAGVAADDIAVITPYNAQVGRIRDALRERYPPLEIGSVDGFQGREKEAVILSLVRSNDTGAVGFLSEHRRTNVAITRPRRHLCVIGDSETVGQSDAFYRHWYAWVSDHAEIRYASADHVDADHLLD